MTELAHRAPQQVAPVMNMNDKMQYAQALAQASLLPKQYQRNPGNVLLAMELGESLGIPPIQAITTVHVIEGKPSASAALISMLVRRAGHQFRIKGDDKSATAEIVRHDDPEFTYSVTWDMSRARNAGVMGKDNWKKYPAAMLKARAITEVARDACQEALMGVQYTPEELGATVDQNGNVVESRGPARQQSQRFGLAGNFPAPAQQVRQEPKSEPVTVEAVEDNAEDTEPAGEEPGDAAVKSSRAQWTLAGQLMTELGIEDKADKATEMRSWAESQGITRELPSMAALSSEECSRFINYLEQLVNPSGGDNGAGEDDQQSWQAAEVPE